MPQPEPGPAEVRVRVEAAGVNFIDVYFRTGAYKGTALPFIPGQEAAGTVDALGSGVTEFGLGDRVAYAPHAGGGYAEFVVVPAARLVPVPSSVSMHTAAAVMLQGMTAHYLSHDTYPIQPGNTVLVHAAAGGVGGLLVQLAKRRGARVLATVSNLEKAALAREAGADEVINYAEVDFAAEVMRLTDGEGVHVVYDGVGKATFDGDLRSLRRRGYLVLYGQSSGAVEPVDPQVLNARGSLFLTRPTLVHYVATSSELLSRASDLFGLIEAGQLQVRVDRTFPLTGAADAHRYLEGRETRGKVLLVL
ncbi:MAG: quinone oxidoreductase [Chloroflexota bacterium]|nr:quinone oxidoreductase [Chloroflexota bacterium]